MQIRQHQLCYIANKNNQKSNIVFFMDTDRNLNIDDEFQIGNRKLKYIGQCKSNKVEYPLIRRM